MLKHLLVTLDGSEISEKALSYLDRIAATGAQIDLLMVVDIPDISAYGLYTMPVSVANHKEIVNTALAGAVAYIEREAAALRERGYKVDTFVVEDMPAQAIVAHADRRHVDAIVMSTHGRGGFSGFLFGSVTQKVLTLTHCPVFVVPGREPVPPAALDKVEVEATAQ